MIRMLWELSALGMFIAALFFWLPAIAGGLN